MVVGQAIENYVVSLEEGEEKDIMEIIEKLLPTAGLNQDHIVSVAVAGVWLDPSLKGASFTRILLKLLILWYLFFLIT